MKKILKKALVLLFVVTLFTNPVITQAATYKTIKDYGTIKYFTYEPNDMLIINSGDTATLDNNVNNGVWYVEAGRNLTYNVSFIMKCNFEIRYFNINTGETVYSHYFEDCKYAGSTIRVPDSGNYCIIIKPSYPTTAIVDSYSVHGYTY